MEEPSNFIFEHYQTHRSSFQKHLQNCLVRNEIEDIHQLRVSVKKIRAILSLIELAEQNHFNKKDHFDLFGKVFDTAGHVREIQINVELTRKIFDLENHPFLDWLLKDLKSDMVRMKKAMTAFDFEKLLKLDNVLIKVSSNLPKEHILKEADEFINKEIQKLYRYQSQLPNDKVLHKVRIHLKAVHEILVLSLKLDSNPVLQEWQVKIKALNQKIGDWHDLAILMDKLQSFKKEAPIETPVKPMVATLAEKKNFAEEEVNCQLTECLSTSVSPISA